MMTAPADSSYGLGIQLGRREAALFFEHGGSNVGFKSHMVAHRRAGFGAVVMTNGEHGGPLIEKAIQSIAREEHWPSATQSLADASVPAP